MDATWGDNLRAHDSIMIESEIESRAAHRETMKKFRRFAHARTQNKQTNMIANKEPKWVRCEMWEMVIKPRIMAGSIHIVRVHLWWILYINLSSEKAAMETETAKEMLKRHL